jgi:hypothetical protein
MTRLPRLFAFVLALAAPAAAQPNDPRLDRLKTEVARAIDANARLARVDRDLGAHRGGQAGR